MIEEPIFEKFWQRDIEESVRQRNVKPFVEEAVLQVSEWGFRLSDLKIQKKRQGKGIIHWLTSIYSQAEEQLTGFLGPIHIWQVSAPHIIFSSSFYFLFLVWNLIISSRIFNALLMSLKRSALLMLRNSSFLQHCFVYLVYLMEARWTNLVVH